MANLSLSKIPNIIQAATPSSPQVAGMVIPFAGSTAPSGWAICDGSELSIASYGQLFGRIGTTWNLCTNPLTGVANSAPAGGNFRIPDLRGTFLRGVGGALATLSGFQTSQNLAHDHGGCTSNIYETNTTFEVKTAGPNTGNFGATFSQTYSGTSSGIRGNISSSGSTEARPQNVGVNYLIKLYDDAGSIVMSGSPFVGSEFQPAPISITGNNTLAISTFYTIDSASPSTQTLPAATGSNSVITLENTGTGLVTVDGNASETINGSLNQVIGQYASLKVRDYAVGKWIIMH